ncbi:MAG: divalent-cation tolerance protein CutA [Calditrichia bacterium]|nr:divalent-cation tolerance protein CutA [Calditrichia bacterium]
MGESGIIVFCTFPNIDEAKSIAPILVKKKLAACCSILPQVTSYYMWDSKLEESQEILMMIKTSHKCYDKLEKQIKMLHSYSVPEIISVDINQGSKAYLDWINESTTT